MVLIIDEIKRTLKNLNGSIWIGLSFYLYVIVCNLAQYELENVILHNMHCCF